MTKAAELANLIGNINAGGGGVNRNIIINGAMNGSQRGTSFSYANGTYCLDRFFMGTINGSSAATVTQDSSSPDGFSNSLKIDVTTADTSLAVNHADQILYRVEAQDLQQLAFGTSSAKNFTLSFYVKSNKTGTYSVNIGQNDNSYKQANLTYTINSANTWERKALTFTGDTSGVINDDNGHGFEIVWVLAAGTNFTSGCNSASFVTYAAANYSANHGVNVFDSTDNTWFLTGVQLEIGQNATEFEHEPVERTLHKCQRYFQLVDSSSGVTVNTTTVQFNVPFPVEMRATPSSVSLSTARITDHFSADAESTSPSPSLSSSDKGGIRVQMSGFSSLTQGRFVGFLPSGGNSLPMRFDAEL